MGVLLVYTEYAGIGWLRNEGDGVDKRITNAIAIVSTTLWAVSFVLDAIIPTYDPPVSVHAVMMTVAGAAFAGSVFKKGDDDDKKKKT